MFTSGHIHGEIIATWKGEPLYHGSLDGDEYRSLLGQNGFQVVSLVVEDPNCGQHTVWLAQRRSTASGTLPDHVGPSGDQTLDHR
jgi:hypothetical protein